jgi:hypothetical protein
MIICGDALYNETGSNKKKNIYFQNAPQTMVGSHIVMSVYGNPVQTAGKILAGKLWL